MPRQRILALPFWLASPSLSFKNDTSCKKQNPFARSPRFAFNKVALKNRNEESKCLKRWQ